ncbi:MAG: MFS transporter [Clostridia bacterium]|nr:MFS transporter [Clostridia bacterium]
METTNKKSISLMVLSFSIMLIIGFLGNLRGALLPTIKQDLGINYSSIGLLIVITGIGYMAATFAAGFICDKIGHKNVFAIGFILVILGLIGITFTSGFVLLTVTMTVMCFGLGCFDIGLNSLTPKIFVTNTAIMLSFLHVFFGVGSALSPQVGSWFLLRDVPWNHVYGYSLAFVALVFIFFMLTPPLPSIHAALAGSSSVSSLLKDSRLWLFIAALAFCESTELGISNWLVNFLQVERGMSEGSSAQYMFYFFIIYTVGRMFGGYIAEKVGYIKIIITFVATAMVLFAGGLFLGNTYAFLFSITGFFISIMFPTMITLISKVFPNNSSSAMGLIITGAGLTCYIINWVIGKINDTMGVFAGFSTVLIYSSMVILLLSIISKRVTYRTRKEIKDSAALCEVE